MNRPYLLFPNEIGFFSHLAKWEGWASSRIYLGDIAWPSALKPRFSRGFGPRLERQLRQSIREIERARNRDANRPSKSDTRRWRNSTAICHQLAIRPIEQHRPKHPVFLRQPARQCAFGILPGMRVIGIGRCPTVGNFAVLNEPPKPPLLFGQHSLPLRLEIRPVPRPVNLAVLAMLPRQLLRLFVDPIEYRQSVG